MRKDMMSVNSSEGNTLVNQSAAAADNETSSNTTSKGSNKEQSSKYRGVNRPKDRDIYTAIVYNNGYMPKKGRTVYLGTFNNEEDAARAYDLIRLKYWGSSAETNFPISSYKEEMEVMAHMTDHEILANIRRSSSRFSRGKSTYRGVARQVNSQKWLANKGKIRGGSFLGTYDTEEEAAMAFDIASIKSRGFDAMTNFDINLYDVEAILEGKAVVVEEETAKQLKEATTLGPLKKKKKKKRRILSSEPSAGEQQETVLRQENKFGALDASRKEQQIASDSRFQDVVNNPFCHYEEMTLKNASLDSSGTSTLSCQHPSSSPDKSYNMQNVIAIRPSSQHRIRDHFQSKQIEARAQGTGFRHASSSCFKPYSKNQNLDLNS